MGFTLDIIINERLYCATHQSLNDPFEGLFSTIKLEGRGIVHSVVKPMVQPIVKNIDGSSKTKIFQSIDNLPAMNRNIRVCSLTAELSDIRMWSYYAGGHTGCAIEIELEPDQEPDLYKVNYREGLKMFRHNLNKDSKAKDILSFKTNHWEHEKEYRVISTEEFYNIEGKVRAVYFGIRTSELNKQLVKRILPGGIPAIDTYIDQENVNVRVKSEKMPNN